MKVIVLGGGESGVGAAIAASYFGDDVFLSDASEISEKYKAKLESFGIDYEEKGHDLNRIYDCDLVIKSPGIPDDIPLIKNFGTTPVISEIEYASRFTDAKIIGVTGSNGKTTTTSLLYHILKKGNKDVGLAGNIGKSFAEMVALEPHDCYLLELSSFQLDGIVEFRADIALLLNITPDHLDRYQYNFENYKYSKSRITENQRESDVFIYDWDDKEIRDIINKNENRILAKQLPFSLEEKLPYGAYANARSIEINMNQENLAMEIQKLALQGKHNTKNMMAAAMAAKIMKVRNKDVYESLMDFEGVEHRLEKFLTINGVQYINDSKATNVNATFYALECMDQPTVWIVGGVDKGNDYSELIPLVREKVKAIICLGIDNAKIVNAFQGLVPIIVETAGAEEATKVAYKLGEKGDCVLLSPACASFDLFDSYEDRGRKFKEAVRKL